jgi:hypothetical protein
MFANLGSPSWPHASLSPREGFGFLLGRVSWPIVLCALALGIYASLEMRGLYADGANFLLRIIETKDFAIIEPARTTVHILQQVPVVLAVRFDLVDVYAASVVYGLTLHLLPLALVAACYPILPEGQKGFFAFPLLHYLAGTMAAGFAPVTEGATAAAYFWLLLYLILFGTERWFGRLVTAALALPVVYAQEAMVFLAPILAMAAAWRACREPSSVGKAWLWSLVVWFLAVIAVQIGSILDPRDLANKQSFAKQMRHFLWLVDGPGLNVPAALGILAGLASLAVAISVMLRAARERLMNRLTWLLIAAFGLASLGLVIATAIGEIPLMPRVQFAARNHPTLLSFPLGLAALASVVWPQLCSLWVRRRNLGVSGHGGLWLARPRRSGLVLLRRHLPECTE